MPLCARGQANSPVDTRRYSIEVAGLRVGTMTATRQAQAGNTITYTLTSDVQVNFLVYHLKVYYQVVNQVRNGQLMLSTVAAHTNQGNFASRTEWKGDHYDIVANQYKYQHRATESQPITYTVTDMFFGEPLGHSKAYAEYFGDYFTLTATGHNTYRAVRDGREDQYHYTNGRLLTIVKTNPLKNFIIRLLPAEGAKNAGAK
ncbi:DUF6134 family protein [Hymenobacter wooponensis]|uniref:DUF3108 domain-containing protein n=1 Tax=Hymenobacter wooponensis TaxID=1525360 RepID=A0A4Z0MSJ0_9BACT|nr:DUF6134 family protein [Hymenobacter wooponensis]TGD82266.1 hypothetical protein EU557_00295 [Hymenobacter wooponensis]